MHFTRDLSHFLGVTPTNEMLKMINWIDEKWVQQIAIPRFFTLDCLVAIVKLLIVNLIYSPILMRIGTFVFHEAPLSVLAARRAQKSEEVDVDSKIK